MQTEESVRVMIEAWKLMAGRFPAGEIREAEGIATMIAHLPMPFLNLSVVDAPLASTDGLRAAMGVARERAHSCRYHSLLGFIPEWVPAGWEPIAAEYGFMPAMSLTGMATENLLPARRPAPALEFRRVADEKTARDIAMINSDAYGMPPEMFECICNLHLWKDDTFGFVGYDGDRAVTCAAAFPVAGTVYLAFVATLTGEHGKGYAEAAMRYTIGAAIGAMGVGRITLHATEMGRPLYSAMGFEAGATTTLLATAGADQ